MDITQVQEKKDELERLIEEKISGFEQDAQIIISSIGLDKLEKSVCGDTYHSYINHIDLEIKLKGRL